jgi:DNA invertase Pin-like site-specific DNA recombinase
MLQIIGAMAEFELVLVKDWVRAGPRNARRRKETLSTMAPKVPEGVGFLSLLRK